MLPTAPQVEWSWVNLWNRLYYQNLYEYVQPAVYQVLYRYRSYTLGIRVAHTFAPPGIIELFSVKPDARAGAPIYSYYTFPTPSASLSPSDSLSNDATMVANAVANDVGRWPQPDIDTFEQHHDSNYR